MAEDDATKQVLAAGGQLADLHAELTRPLQALLVVRESILRTEAPMLARLQSASNALRDASASDVDSAAAPSQRTMAGQRRAAAAARLPRAAGFMPAVNAHAAPNAPEPADAQMRRSRTPLSDSESSPPKDATPTRQSGEAEHELPSSLAPLPSHAKCDGNSLKIEEPVLRLPNTGMAPLRLHEALPLGGRASPVAQLAGEASSHVTVGNRSGEGGTGAPGATQLFNDTGAAPVRGASGPTRQRSGRPVRRSIKGSRPRLSIPTQDSKQQEDTPGQEVLALLRELLALQKEVQGDLKKLASRAAVFA